MVLTVLNITYYSPRKRLSNRMVVWVWKSKPNAQQMLLVPVNHTARIRRKPSFTFRLRIVNCPSPSKILEQLGELHQMFTDLARWPLRNDVCVLFWRTLIGLYICVYILNKYCAQIFFNAIQATCDFSRRNLSWLWFQTGLLRLNELCLFKKCLLVGALVSSGPD